MEETARLVFVLESEEDLRGGLLLRIFWDSGRVRIATKKECGQQRTSAFGVGAPNPHRLVPREGADTRTEWSIAKEFSSGEPHVSYTETTQQAAQSAGPAPAGPSSHTSPPIPGRPDHPPPQEEPVAKASGYPQAQIFGSASNGAHTRGL